LKLRVRYVLDLESVLKLLSYGEFGLSKLDLARKKQAKG